MTTTKKTPESGVVTPLSVAPLNEETTEFTIIGISPYVQNRFSEKAKAKMRAKMAAGSTAAKGTKREPRDFDADFKAAHHISTDGWTGIPATAFRNALIEACRVAGFQMVRAKMSVFVEAQGYDRDDATPLIKIIGRDPERLEHVVRQQMTTDIRVRPGWREWSARVRVSYDADQFTQQDVANLMVRAGRQVGIGEGRPLSKSSNGMGWGTFRLAREDEV